MKNWFIALLFVIVLTGTTIPVYLFGAYNENLRPYYIVIATGGIAVLMALVGLLAWLEWFASKRTVTDNQIIQSNIQRLDGLTSDLSQLKKTVFEQAAQLKSIQSPDKNHAK